RYIRLPPLVRGPMQEPAPEMTSFPGFLRTPRRGNDPISSECAKIEPCARPGRFLGRCAPEGSKSRVRETLPAASRLVFAPSRRPEGKTDAPRRENEFLRWFRARAAARASAYAHTRDRHDRERRHGHGTGPGWITSRGCRLLGTRLAHSSDGFLIVFANRKETRHGDHRQIRSDPGDRGHCREG